MGSHKDISQGPNNMQGGQGIVAREGRGEKGKRATLDRWLSSSGARHRGQPEPSQEGDRDTGKDKVMEKETEGGAHRAYEVVENQYNYFLRQRLGLDPTGHQKFGP